MKRIFVTGGAGFIGSHVCERLLQDGYSVTAYDNLSLGRKELLTKCFKFTNFEFFEADLLDLPRLKEKMSGHQLVFHLAANSDISSSNLGTDLDFKNGTLATYNVLESMRTQKIGNLVFSSTSAIYGEATQLPTTESYGPLMPISLYGASKLGCEALCSAFANNFGIRTRVYRFANIVGSHSTHGVIFDFISRLKKDASVLNVLGNGSQRKSYLHVMDCVEGMLHGWKHGLQSDGVGVSAPTAGVAAAKAGTELVPVSGAASPNASTSDRFQIFNLASRGVTTVKFIAEEVVKQFSQQTGTHPKIQFGDGDRGWVGDVPYTYLDGSRLEGLGWQAKLESNHALQTAVTEILAEQLAATPPRGGGSGV